MVYRWKITGVAMLFLVMGFQAGMSRAFAQEADSAWVCKVISVQGPVLVKRQRDSRWQSVNLNDTLFAGDRIRVEANGRAGIVLRNDAVLRLDQNTTLVFSKIEQETTFIFKLLKGAANFFSHRPRSLKIFTPFVNGVVEGTEFYIQVDAEQTRIDLFEGRILATNPHGELQLTKGQGAVASYGSPPRPHLLVQPRDSVQWALYYPPVLALEPDAVPEELQKSVQLSNRGKTLEAVNELGQVEESARDARFFAYRAALSLHLGRVFRARDDIQQSLALDPGNAEALALQTVIAVVQNRKEKALETAQKAVQRDAGSAAAQMALSYAHQARFNLPGALKAAQDSVNRAPGNGAAWARLAELRLSTGELGQGIQAARRAAKLNPDVAHAHTMLGFAYLTQIKIEKARRAFEKAIALDSAAPLPRLGLGLAKIRDGDLEQGRAEIEIAVGLDPTNSLMRSYLGKAYFDEKRGPRDAKQLDIAKALDPNDPTPWFYDAVRKQTLNRPGEALQDLQKSIELNDNRAVYRSRLLLDEDLAARSAALGRIYNDLSFQEQALREGAKSLRADPTNFSAHRLLSDIYASRPNHEITQVSELLQSQLLQPLNLTPVPPQAAESTLVVSEGAGPLSASFNEFNPLFTRNQLALQISGATGSNAYRSGEASVAGIYKRLSFSAGRYHSETDGFRPNNDLEKDISIAFVQTALSPYTSIQLEYRQKEITHGDLDLKFDPQDFEEIKQITREDRIPRFGLHYAPNINHHFITSLIFNKTEFSQYTEQVLGATGFGPIIAKLDQIEKPDSYNVEGQYLYRSKNFNTIIGAGYYEQDFSGEMTTSVTSGPLVLLPETTTPEDSEIWHTNAYMYTYLKILSRVDVTLGLSGDSYKEGEKQANQINPKFGINWYLSPSLSIRAAAFRSLKRSLVSNQTIEPSQIAGFAQFFDDYAATDAKRYGLGGDYQISDHLSCGVEMTRNDLSHQRGAPLRVEKHSEYHHLIYLHWLPLSQLSMSAEYRFDDYERAPLPVAVDRPFELRTHSAPLTLTYFHPSGLFAKAKGTFINQRLKQYITSALPPETKRDNFTLMDIGIGYRLPARYGFVSFSINNVFDTNFNYRDTNFLKPSSNPQDPEIKPERQYYLKATFSF